VVLRDAQEDAERMAAGIRRTNGGWDGPGFVGTPDVLVEKLVPIARLGFRHFYFDFPAPYDDETLERLVGEVKPSLEQAS